MKTDIGRAGKTVLLLISATLAAQQYPLLSASATAALESLSHGFYYQSAQEWKKLDLTRSSGFSIKHGASALVGVSPGGVRLYDGPQAANQFENRRPIFGIRVDGSRPDVPGRSPRDLIIVRMAKKKDHRELQVIKGGFESMQTGINSKDVVEVALSSVAERTFIVTPKSDLAPGEYVATFRAANGLAGYDFGIE